MSEISTCPTDQKDLQVRLSIKNGDTNSELDPSKPIYFFHDNGMKLKVYDIKTTLAGIAIELLGEVVEGKASLKIPVHNTAWM